MPKIKYKNFLEKLEKASVFTYKQIENVLGKNYAKLWIHKMLESGKIIKLTKGFYSFKHSPYLVVTALGRAYVGLGSAAFLHGAWNQLTSIYVLSPDAGIKVRTGIREVCNFKVIIMKISEKMYFGFTEIFLEDVEEWIKVSDPEKTIIDMIYYSYPFTEEILPNLLEVANLEKLKEYLKTMKERKVKGWKMVEEKLNIFSRDI